MNEVPPWNSRICAPSNDILVPYVWTAELREVSLGYLSPLPDESPLKKEGEREENKERREREYKTASEHRVLMK